MEPRAAHRFVSLSRAPAQLPPGSLSSSSPAPSLCSDVCGSLAVSVARTFLAAPALDWAPGHAPLLFDPRIQGGFGRPFRQRPAVHQLAIRPPRLPEPAPLERSDRVRHPRMRTHPRAMSQLLRALDRANGSESSGLCSTRSPD